MFIGGLYASIRDAAMGEPAPVQLQTVSGLTVAGGYRKVNLAVLLEGD